MSILMLENELRTKVDSLKLVCFQLAASDYWHNNLLFNMLYTFSSKFAMQNKEDRKKQNVTFAGFSR